MESIENIQKEQISHACLTMYQSNDKIIACQLQIYTTKTLPQVLPEISLIDYTHFNNLFELHTIEETKEFPDQILFVV